MKRPKPSSRPTRGLPDRQTLIDFLRDAGEAQKADIAKHFGLKGEERRALRHMLKALEEEGALGKRGRRGFAQAGALPPVGVVDVTSRDVDGDLFVTLVKGGDDIEPVRLAPARGESVVGAPGLGDRFLARCHASQAPSGSDLDTLASLHSGGMAQFRSGPGSGLRHVLPWPANLDRQ